MFIVCIEFLWQQEIAAQCRLMECKLLTTRSSFGLIEVLRVKKQNCYLFITISTLKMKTVPFLPLVDKIELSDEKAIDVTESLWALKAFDSFPCNFSLRSIFWP